MDGIDLGDAQQLLDNELDDKMDKYGYTGLDQLLNKAEEVAEVHSDDKFPENKLKYVDL